MNNNSKMRSKTKPRSNATKILMGIVFELCENGNVIITVASKSIYEDDIIG